MPRATRFARLALVLAIAAAPAFAQMVLPPPTGFVNDFAKVVDDASRTRMETMARNFRDRSGIEVAVVTLPSLEGRTIEEVGLQIGREWHLGAKQEKDGVVVLLAIQDRQSRVEVSRHLEGDLTDLASFEIIRQARPRFAAGQYGQGLQQVLESVLATIAESRGLSIDGIDRAKAYHDEPRRRSTGSTWASRIMFLVVLVIVIAAFANSGGGGGYGGRRRRRGLSPWILPGVFWGSGGGGGWSGGSWGDSGGSWGGGGGGGGGFGGFGGGGDFGGGGASDSW